MRADPSPRHLGSLHRILDVCRRDHTHRNNGSHGNQRGDQHVLDNGGALFALHQLTKDGQHGFAFEVSLERSIWDSIQGLVLAAGAMREVLAK